MKHERKKPAAAGAGGGKKRGQMKRGGGRSGRRGDKDHDNNTEALSRGKSIASRKRAALAARAQECVFDPAARADFLTGFHRRKVERRNAALRKSAQESRADRLKMRADLREQRAAALRQRLEAHRAELGLDDDAAHDDADDSWHGFDDDDAEKTDNGGGGGGEGKEVKKRGLWAVNEYEDDEKLVSVEVSEM